MARPTRCRRVCAEPACPGFTPRGETQAGEVVLTVDEYEVIRLVDYEKRTHRSEEHPSDPQSDVCSSDLLGGSGEP